MQRSEAFTPANWSKSGAPISSLKLCCILYERAFSRVARFQGIPGVCTALQASLPEPTQRQAILHLGAPEHWTFAVTQASPCRAFHNKW
ncbi:hypothetical protein BKD09_41755 [Bradyrhizobium japonicum]|uniref:Uncharacterized protein n=1 Tax=Bradyrhizobium japonicum TaxID=375 RepID=A0A1L3FNI6_BRAJP|nr:hypothetical protein BKD09_41755 [Bradyrhizobium japonicum]